MERTLFVVSDEVVDDNSLLLSTGAERTIADVQKPLKRLYLDALVQHIRIMAAMSPNGHFDVLYGDGHTATLVPGSVPASVADVQEKILALQGAQSSKPPIPHTPHWRPVPLSQKCEGIVKALLADFGSLGTLRVIYLLPAGYREESATIQQVLSHVLLKRLLPKNAKNVTFDLVIARPAAEGPHGKLTEVSPTYVPLGTDDTQTLQAKPRLACRLVTFTASFLEYQPPRMAGDFLAWLLYKWGLTVVEVSGARAALAGAIAGAPDALTLLVSCVPCELVGLLPPCGADHAYQHPQPQTVLLPLAVAPRIRLRHTPGAPKQVRPLLSGPPPSAFLRPFWPQARPRCSHSRPRVGLAWTRQRDTW